MKNALVIRLNSIGDIVLASPIVRCLVLQGGYVVHFLVKSTYAHVLDHNPYIEKVIEYDKDAGTHWATLKSEKYELIIDLHNNLRSRRVAGKINGKGVYVDRASFQKWLYIHWRINKFRFDHVVDNYFQCVRPLGIENDGMGLDYYFSGDADRRFNDMKLPAAYACINVSASFETKKIPEAIIVQLIRQLEFPVVLTGGIEDISRGEWIERHSESKQLYNLCGRLALEDSANVVRHSVVLITGDTGLMHIAAAVNTPVVAVYGSTDPVFGFKPYFPKNPEYARHVMVKDLPCRPCSRQGKPSCPKKHFKCMRTLNIDEIVDNALFFIEKGKLSQL